MIDNSIENSSIINSSTVNNSIENGSTTKHSAMQFENNFKKGYIDTHCHLTWPNIYEKVHQVIVDAMDKGVNYLHTICTKEADMVKILDLINQYDMDMGEEINLDNIDYRDEKENGEYYKVISNNIKNNVRIYGSVGVHPNDAAQGEFMSQDKLVKYVTNHKKIISIGETGLDKFRGEIGFDKQKKSFEEHIAAALKCNVPLVIHSRDAEQETYEMLKNTGVKGILHCFTGSLDFAKKCLDLGLYISFSGIVTFKNSHLPEVVKYVPIDRIVAETDAPYLTPVPFRGKPNAPANVRYVYDKISEIKHQYTGIDKGTIDEQIIANGYRVLNL